MHQSKHPLFQKEVDQRFAEVCTPEQAYHWLKEQRPPISVYRNRFSLIDDHREIETILLHRQDALIDHGLARYGWSIEVADKLYPRLEIKDRIIMRCFHIAAAGPFFADDAEITPDLIREIEAWATNPNLGDGHFERLFKRSDIFERLSDDEYMGVIRCAGYNKRLQTPYESLFLDGFDDYTYHKVFAEAWNLVMQVEPTDTWAGALISLLQNCVPYGYQIDVDEALERWRIDEKPYDKDKWHSMSRSWYLRSYIALLEKDDKKLLQSDDAACRAAFYTRFDPTIVTNWREFAQVDGEVFFEHAMRNGKIWRSTPDRHALERIAWALPDKHSTMDAQNSYRAREQWMKEEHPDWFADDEIDTLKA